MGSGVRSPSGSPPWPDERLEQVAELFNLTPAQYAKACLYRDLGCYLEPLDRRKTRHKRRRVLTWEREEVPE